MEKQSVDEVSKWPEEQFMYLGADGCNYDSPIDYFWIGKLGFCGCYSHNIVELAWDILNKLYKARVEENHNYYYDYKDKSEDFRGLQELILHIFDKAKITEHGSSVRGSWLMDEGFEFAKKVIEDYQRGPEVKSAT